MANSRLRGACLPVEPNTQLLPPRIAVPPFDDLRAARRRRFRRRRRNIAILLIVAAIVAFLPGLLLQWIGPRQIASSLEGRLGAKVTIARVRGSWWDPIVLEGVEVGSGSLRCPRIRTKATLLDFALGHPLRLSVESPLVRLDRELLRLRLPAREGEAVAAAESRGGAPGGMGIEIRFEDGRLQLPGRPDELHWSGGIKRDVEGGGAWSCLLEARDRDEATAQLRARFSRDPGAGVRVEGSAEVSELSPVGWAEALGLPGVQRVQRVSLSASFDGTQAEGVRVSVRGRGIGAGPADEVSLEVEALGYGTQWRLVSGRARRGGLAAWVRSDARLEWRDGRFHLRARGVIDAPDAAEFLAPLLEDQPGVQAQGALRFEGLVSTDLDGSRLRLGTWDGELSLAVLKTPLGDLRDLRGTLSLGRGRLVVARGEARLGDSKLKIEGDLGLLEPRAEMSFLIEKPLSLRPAVGPLRIGVRTQGQATWTRSRRNSRLQFALSAPALAVRGASGHRVVNLDSVRLSGALRWPTGSRAMDQGSCRLDFAGGHVDLSSIAGDPLDAEGRFRFRMTGEVEGERRSLLGDPLLLRLEKALSFSGSWDGSLAHPGGEGNTAELVVATDRLGLGSDEGKVSLADCRIEASLAGGRLRLTKATGSAPGGGISLEGEARIQGGEGARVSLKGRAEHLPLTGGLELLVARLCPFLLGGGEESVAGFFGGSIEAQGVARTWRWWEELDGVGQLDLDAVTVREPRIVLQMGASVHDALSKAMREELGAQTESSQWPAAILMRSASSGFRLDGAGCGFGLKAGRLRLESPLRFTAPELSVDLEGETLAGGGGRFTLRSDLFSRLVKRYGADKLQNVSKKELGAQVEVESGRHLRVTPLLFDPR